ncbi:MAG: hypothetical protein ACI9IL_001167, partial [Rickettsiales bacterium]
MKTNKDTEGFKGEWNQYLKDNQDLEGKLDFSHFKFDTNDKSIKKIFKLLIDECGEIKDWNFAEMRFPAIDFYGSTFQEEVDFSESTFSREVIFTGSIFSANISAMIDKASQKAILSFNRNKTSSTLCCGLLDR